MPILIPFIILLLSKFASCGPRFQSSCKVGFLSIDEIHKASQTKNAFNSTLRFECHTADGNGVVQSKGVTKGANGGKHKWYNKKVPYILDCSLTNEDRIVFAKAIEEISTQTRFKFNPRGSESDYLKVERECSCGETGGKCFNGAYTDGLGPSPPRRLVISSACLSSSNTNSIGLLIHELLHVIGIEHTQKRPDRNVYIKINNGNIKPKRLRQYEQCSSCLTHGTPYDCMSVMHYRDYFFQKHGAGPTMTAVNPSTCDLSSDNVKLRPADVELIQKMYYDKHGTDLYLYIQSIDDGSQCSSTHKLPGHSSFKTGGKIDLKKLYNNPYAGSYKYWTKFGGFGIAESTPFEGCIDDNNQELVATGFLNTGLLKFSNIQVPGWWGSGSWGTTIWINVMSQCQHSEDCDTGTGHWWKFEKELSPPEAERFANTHLTPEFADSSVAGTPVVLQYMGQISCDKDATYGCDPSELN